VGFGLEMHVGLRFGLEHDVGLEGLHHCLSTKLGLQN